MTASGSATTASSSPTPRTTTPTTPRAPTSGTPATATRSPIRRAIPPTPTTVPSPTATARVAVTDLLDSGPAGAGAPAGGSLRPAETVGPVTDHQSPPSPTASVARH